MESEKQKNDDLVKDTYHALKDKLQPYIDEFMNLEVTKENYPAGQKILRSMKLETAEARRFVMGAIKCCPEFGEKIRLWKSIIMSSKEE